MPRTKLQYLQWLQIPGNREKANAMAKKARDKYRKLHGHGYLPKKATTRAQKWSTSIQLAKSRKRLEVHVDVRRDIAYTEWRDKLINWEYLRCVYQNHPYALYQDGTPLKELLYEHYQDPLYK